MIRPPKPATNRLIFWAACVGVILVAFLFRFYRIADYPLGLFFDPAINGLDAVRLIQRGGYVLFFPTNGGRESLFMYLLIPFIRFFGTTPFSIGMNNYEEQYGVSTVNPFASVEDFMLLE